MKSEAVSKDNKDQLQKSVDLLQEAILDENSNLEGLFYFHLGDGFRRLGSPERADIIFQLAADRQIFIRLVANLLIVQIYLIIFKLISYKAFVTKRLI